MISPSKGKSLLRITILVLAYLQLSSTQNCSAGSFYNGTICLNCPNNTFSIGNSTNCSYCSNCLECEATDGTCTLCLPGYGSGTQSCAPCNNTSFSDGRQLCNACGKECATCNTTVGSCITCNPGYGLSEGGNECTACSISNSYSPGGNVSCMNCSCPSGCSAITGVCICSPGYQPVTGGCQICLNNTYSDGTTECKDCQAGCLNCSSVNGGCQSCLPGYVYESSDNGSCILCNISNCTSCSTTNLCQGCSDQLVPNSSGGACVSCNLTNCAACSSDNYCLQCVPGYLPINGTCSSCGVALCTSCKLNTTTSSNSTYQCTACAQGYVIDLTYNTCSVNCAVKNCSSCSSATICTQCKNDFTLSNNNCYPNCGIEYCINCKGLICNQCADNYTLVGSQICAPYCAIQGCIQCDDYSYCVACSNGLSVSSDGSECVQCNISSCISCGSDNICDICYGDLRPQLNGECLQCSVDNCFDCSSNNECSVRGCYKGYSFNENASSTQNQCITCLNPCKSCYADGSCMTCIYPYSTYLLQPNSSCFYCADLNCASCVGPYSGNCSVCVSEQFSIVNNSCILTCSNGCLTCNSTACITCQIFYYMQPNNTCTLCPLYPQCTSCNPSNSTVVTGCNIGFILYIGICLLCQSYCAVCSSLTFCLTLLRPDGLTLVSTATINNSPASCDPGCFACSNINPTLCTTCYRGFYLYSLASSSTISYCIPCEPSSYCSSCSPSNPTFCTQCFPGSFLNQQNVCVQCLFPCTSCGNRQANNCTGCAIGYILSNNICLSITTLDTQDSTVLQNCANARAYRDHEGNTQYNCTLCLQGYTYTGYGCAPCIIGCLICDASNLAACIQCSLGFSLNISTNICTACYNNCLLCINNVGCLSCAQGYYINHIFLCEPNCIIPCATCLSATQCTECVLGYTLNGRQCQPDISCSKDFKCQVCPYGYALITNSTAANFNQTCVACANSSNCARCNTSNLTQCTSCSIGFYLFNSLCLDCPLDCANCLSPDICLNCSVGFVPQQSGSIRGNLAVGNLSCISCISPCLSCVGSVTTCTGCIQNYTLQGNVCLSNFYYQVNTTLLVSLSIFQANYLAYLNQLSAAAGISVQNCVVKTIISGSVLIITQLSSPSPPNTPTAINAQNALNNILSSGMVADMQVGAFSFDSYGGKNNITNDTNDNSGGSGGISVTTIIILATVIPAGTLAIAGAIVAIYCKRKRNKLQNIGLNSDIKNGETTGRTIEMSIGQPKAIEGGFI